MKYIILFFFISFTAAGQTNDLTVSDFMTIKFGDVNLSDIKETKGNRSDLESLLGDSFISKTGDEPDYWVEFSSSSFCLLFQDGEKVNNVLSNYQLTNLKLENNLKNLLIKGVIVKIGDNISKLGNVNILAYSTGVNRIVYKLGSEVIRISFNEQTNVITEIEYEYYN